LSKHTVKSTIELVVKQDETRELRAKFIKGNAPNKTVPCTIQKKWIVPGIFLSQPKV
jgi:hypothetical protein